jgi:hypothetical protein
MTTLRRLLFLLVLVFPLAGPVWAQAWKEYVFPEAGFAAQFPAAPSLTQGLAYDADNELVPQKIYGVDHEGIAYRVLLTEMPGADRDRELGAAIRATRDYGAVVDAFYGDLCGERVESVTVEQPDGMRRSNMVFFLAGRLYQISASYHPDLPHSGRASAFRLSFRHLSMGEKSDVPSDGC